MKGVYEWSEELRGNGGCSDFERAGIAYWRQISKGGGRN